MKLKQDNLISRTPRYLVAVLACDVVPTNSQFLGP